MVKVLLASDSKIKENAIKKWFKINLKEIELKLTKSGVSDVLVPPQPMNTGGIYCCLDRITNVEKGISILDYDYIISIESSLKVSKDEIADNVNVCIKNCITGKIYQESGQDIILNYKILEKYPLFVKVLQDLYSNYELTSKKYIYDGCESTLGSLINRYYSDIPKNNWMKYVCNKDRENQIYKVLNKLTNDMLNEN